LSFILLLLKKNYYEKGKLEQKTKSNLNTRNSPTRIMMGQVAHKQI
jgi:hypothetical protein